MLYEAVLTYLMKEIHVYKLESVREVLQASKVIAPSCPTAQSHHWAAWYSPGCVVPTPTTFTAPSGEGYTERCSIGEARDEYLYMEPLIAR